MKNLIDDRGFISILDGDDSLEIDVPTTFNEPITFGTGSALIFNGNNNPRKIYVTLSGSDTTGDGSFLNPYRTVAKGVQVANNATNRALTTPYVIEVGAGTFTETQFPVFVSQSIMIKGQGGNMTRITSAQTGITFFQMDYRTFITDLTLNGGGEFNNKGIEVDIFNPITASANVNFVVPRILDCSFNGFNQGVSVTGVSGGVVLKNSGFNDCREGVTFISQSAYSEINNCNFDFFAITGSAILLKEGNRDTYFGQPPDIFIRNNVFRFCQSAVRSTATDQTKGMPVAAAFNVFISCSIVLDLNEGSMAYFFSNRAYNTSTYELYQGFAGAKLSAIANTVDLSKVLFQPAGAANISAINYSLVDGDTVRYFGEHPETWYRTIATTIQNGAQWRVRVETPGLFAIDNNTDAAGQFATYKRPFYINNSGSLNLEPYSGSIAASLSGNLILLNGAEARFLQPGNSTANYFGVKAPATVSSSLTYTLPAAVPSTISYLQADTSGNLTWASGIGGEVNTASNLGAGFGLFAQKVSSDLQFKTLIAGTGVSFTSSSQAITMSISSTGEANTASNLGTSFGLFAQKVGVDLQFKNLVAGSGIQLASSSTGITIATSGSGDDVTSGTNLGTGAGIYDSKLLGSLQFKSLTATSSSVGNILSVSSSETEINISRSPTSRTIHISEDWIANTYQGNYFWAQTIGGTGAGSNIISTDVNSTTQKAIGEVQLTTGTTATGRACLAQSLIGWRLDNLENSVQEWRVYVPTLSDITNEYSFVIGWLNIATTTAQTAGLYFSYNRAVTGVNWQAVATATTSTTVDTGVAVGTTNFVKLRIETNNALGQARYYIDGVLVATITTTLPTGTGRLVGPGAIIFKSVGTTARVINIDYMELVANIAGR